MGCCPVCWSEEGKVPEDRSWAEGLSGGVGPDPNADQTLCRGVVCMKPDCPEFEQVSAVGAARPASTIRRWALRRTTTTRSTSCKPAFPGACNAWPVAAFCGGCVQYLPGGVTPRFSPTDRPAKSG